VRQESLEGGRPQVLRDEKRIALRPIRQGAHHLGGRGACQHIADHDRQRRLVEALEHVRVHVRMVDELRDRARRLFDSVKADDEDTGAREVLTGNGIENGKRQVIGPLQIVDDQQKRASATEAHDELAHRLHRALPFCGRRQSTPRVHVPLEQVTQGRFVLGQDVERRRRPEEVHRHVPGTADIRRALQEAAERFERDTRDLRARLRGGRKRHAFSRHHVEPVSREQTRQFGGEEGLSDPALAADENEVTLPAQSSPCKILDFPDDVVPPYEPGSKQILSPRWGRGTRNRRGAHRTEKVRHDLGTAESLVWLLGQQATEQLVDRVGTL
jgi:hypothetical protein